MNDRPGLDRFVTDWLRDEAPPHAPGPVLAGAIARVATLGQEHYATQRLFGDRLGRSRVLRYVLAVVLLAVAVLGAIALAGALRREPSIPPPLGASNGWLVFAANGEAGPDLQNGQVGRGNGKGDLYVVREGVPARRIIGQEDDQLHQGCATFSPYGTRLAYTELDMRTVTPTGAPQPEGAPPVDQPPAEPDSPVWRIVVVGIDDDGNATSVDAQLPVQANMTSCAEWSPTGQQLAYVAEPPSGGHELWVVALDGRETRFDPAVNLINSGGGFDWSPDGSTIAFLDGEQVWLVPIDGGAPRRLPGGGIGSVSWSPDGTRLAVGVGSAIEVLTADGTFVASVAGGGSGEDPPGHAWSPDGQWLAYVEGDDIVKAAADGSRTVRRPFDIDRLLEGLIEGELYPPTPSVIGWSPDGERLLLAAGGLDSPGAIFSISVDGSAPDALLVGPTFALRGIEASWEEVYE